MFSQHIRSCPANTETQNKKRYNHVYSVAVSHGGTDPTQTELRLLLRYKIHKGKGKVHPCTGTEIR